MITPAFNLTATERVLPKLALDFTTALLDSRITFTRTTGASNPATYVNSNGNVTSATNNQPRFDYNAITLACKGLLIEESRANQALSSDAFDAANWLKTRTTVTADTIISPSGATDADKIIDTAVSGTHAVQTSTLLTIVSTAYAGSVYAKAAERTWIAVSIGTTVAGIAYFNLSNGTIGSVTAGFTASITPAGNGWYRCSISGTISVANQSAMSIYLALANNSASYVGDGTSGAYLWGAQLEAGAFATSYIPTTTTALTRNADVATMTGTNFSDWFNASEGTFACEFLTAGGIPTPQYAFLAQNAGTTDFIGTIRTTTSSGLIQGLTYVGGADQATLGTLTAGNNSLVNACQSYKANAFRFSSFGTATLSDNTGSVPSVDRMYIGNRLAGDRALNGHMRQLSYWPQQVTSAETQAFSKG